MEVWQSEGLVQTGSQQMSLSEQWLGNLPSGVNFGHSVFPIKRSSWLAVGVRMAL